jgi:Zn-dependent protease
MSDLFSWSMTLGRWFGTNVKLHLTLVLFFVLEVVFELLGRNPRLGPTLVWLGLLALTIGIHLVGQILVANRLGFEFEEVRAWPAGQLFLPSLSGSRQPELAMAAMSGPLVSLVLAIGVGITLPLLGARMIFDPFGMPRVDPPAPAVVSTAPEPVAPARQPGVRQAPEGTRPVAGAASAAGEIAPPPRIAFGGGTPLDRSGVEVPSLTTVWILGWFGYLNWVLCLINLVPALPFAGGRFLRAVSGTSWGERDRAIVPHTARACAIVLGVVGLMRWLLLHKPGGVQLIALAILIDLMVRLEARWLEERGYFEEATLGYDFSQGYTSLDAQQPKVRPARESALRRWRRLRSEHRRQRLDARLSAESERMDEILSKLYREGRDSLTYEEHRFLVRVSARLRNKTKTPSPHGEEHS